MATDKLNAMSVFRRVAELGSFTKAADDLNVTAATISKHIAFLEKHLNTRLINRTTRRMHLTDTGLIFLQRTQALLDDLDDAELEVAGLQAEPRGRMRINAPMSFGLTHITAAVDSFLTLYPDIEIDLQLNDHLVDLVEQGVDIAIRVRNELPDSTMIAKALRHSRNIVCASPEYLKNNMSIKHPRDLKNHNCLLFSLHEKPCEWALGQHTVSVTGNYRVDSSLAIRDSLLSGMGVGLVPRFVVEQDIKKGRLCALLENHPPKGYTIFAVFPPGRRQPTKVRAFIEHLNECLGNHDYWD